MISFCILCPSLKPFTVMIQFSLARTHTLSHRIFCLIWLEEMAKWRFSFWQLNLKCRQYRWDVWLHYYWFCTILWTPFCPSGIVRIKSWRQFSRSLLSVFVKDPVSEWYNARGLYYLCVILTSGHKDLILGSSEASGVFSFEGVLSSRVDCRKNWLQH